jgi:hypothetical protein
MRHLQTFDQVLNAVGGFRALAELCGVTPPLTYVWRRNGRLPAYTYDQVDRELALRGITVARSLFDWGPAKAGKKTTGVP